MKSINCSPVVKWLALLLLVFVCSETTIDGHRAQASSTLINKESSDLRGGRLALITRQYKNFNARGRIRDGIMIGDVVTPAQVAMVNGDDTSHLR